MEAGQMTTKCAQNININMVHNCYVIYFVACNQPKKTSANDILGSEVAFRYSLLTEY